MKEKNKKIVLCILIAFEVIFGIFLMKERTECGFGRFSEPYLSVGELNVPVHFLYTGDFETRQNIDNVLKMALRIILVIEVVYFIIKIKMDKTLKKSFYYSLISICILILILLGVVDYIYPWPIPEL